jgi:hypothetical protein
MAVLPESVLENTALVDVAKRLSWNFHHDNGIVFPEIDDCP